MDRITPPTVADAMADWLLGNGVTTAFGIIGGGNVTLFDALAKRINVVCCHHEQAAAMAATYYWRTCERIAPVVVTSGAGSANAITGVMAAHMDGVPLLVLAGNEKLAAMQERTRIIGIQGFRSDYVAEHFTKLARMVASARFALSVLEECYKAATTPRYGATWINIPADVQRDWVSQ